MAFFSMEWSEAMAEVSGYWYKVSGYLRTAS